MQLTLYTDYSLRVLAYLAVKHGELITISEIADFYGISRNHLVKVVHNLSSRGFIETVRGKNGGMRLARPMGQIGIGDVVRVTEPNFHIVECMDDNNGSCIVEVACALKMVLEQANQQFLAVLDQFTVADIIKKDKASQQLIHELVFFPSGSKTPPPN
ncbi:MAG: Rrf2 family transcriptional regulator [Gammaproteobacteria bacterium]|nr:Rrf2 family transcriptional regulator [Gammaproteobacteria bacterium]